LNEILSDACSTKGTPLKLMNNNSFGTSLQLHQ
jgi:hypothetical protein